ncbi:tRNA (adenosine(37)-N6)-threonylcarbamoyltransferase complex transferase subunit TsaD [Desulforegula conservatrix]|uniref:tRNA (adenosine(37)-N6)-threonylcarbamoyltransferase complex transferase subunit TsaD n=1 Tax=Desulforegula conservatrix TaxID=153026 RepID=UPI000415F6E7|nr:tRNA (adenosine(37)-N6)-threonylcarbamoyltransferase complex transferase subunit TsaD [Desulforegula conservatrix]
MKILGIESSCDETAAAIVENGRIILSSVVASQIEIHAKYGGVVPELASRKHIESIVAVVDESIKNAGITFEEIDAVAATQGPGLVGALLTGFSFAKAFAWARKLPFIGVDHLEGHMLSVFLNEKGPEFPYVALLASGGHTSLYLVKSYTDFEPLGHTRDDAAGEAYDKVSKMLGLGYPGGAVIDNLAASGDHRKIKFPKPFLDKESFDFSFSGLKSAAARYIQENKETYKCQLEDIAASFQESVTEVLTYKLIRAAVENGCSHIAITGGVAANRGLRQKATREAEKNGLTIHIPDISLCGDNAAMIASSGYYRLLKNITCPLDTDVYSRKP